MAVYVDDMQLPADVDNNGRAVRGRWSHLFAGTSAELEDFARKLGLSSRWIQHQGEPGEHYDVTESKRQQALKLGAQQITYREAGLMFAGRREEARRSAEQRAGRPARPPEAGAAREQGRLPGDARGSAALRALAAGLDRAAGARFRQGDYQGALTFLNEARVAYPDMAPALTEHTCRVLAAAVEAQAMPPASASAKPGRQGYCSSCGTAELTSGRTVCQACRAVEAYLSTPPQVRQYPDLSHGQPGHLCVLPGAAQAEPEVRP
jgi:Protein of unknown function (DUF4031)